MPILHDQQMIRGGSVSMPSESAVIPLPDGLDPSARAIDPVNTIVVDDGGPTGQDTDHPAAATPLRARAVDRSSSALLRGSGGTAGAVLAALSGQVRAVAAAAPRVRAAHAANGLVVTGAEVVALRASAFPREVV